MGRAIIDPRRPVTEGGLQLKSSTGHKSWPPRSARFDSERIDTDKEMHPGSVIQDRFASAVLKSWHQTARQTGRRIPWAARPPSVVEIQAVTRTTCSEPQRNGARESNPAREPSPCRSPTIRSLPFMVGIETPFAIAPGPRCGHCLSRRSRSRAQQQSR